VGEKVFGSLDQGPTWTDITSSVSGSALSWTGASLLDPGQIFNDIQDVFIRLQVRDAAGNVGATATQQYQLDITAPTTTFSHLGLSADTGTGASDFVTRTAAQTITATLGATLAMGETLFGSVDGGTTWVNITNKVTNTALSWDGVTLSGTSSIQLQVRDAAGNVGTAATQAYTLDTTAPSTTFSGVGLSADTGTPGDFITNTAAQTISATLSAALATGEALFGSVNGGSTWVNITNKVTGRTLSWDAATLSGSSIQLQVRDAAGNVGTAVTQTYTLDTVPSNVNITDILISDDTGLSATDFVTQTAEQTISANLAVGLATGEALFGSVDGGSTWTNITNQVSGTTIRWTGVTLSGASSIQLQVRDLAGNAAPSGIRAYTQDNTAPAAPAGPSAYTDDTGAVLSASSTAAITDETRPGIRVPTGLVDTPKLYVNGVLTAATYDASTGTLTPNSGLSEGVHLFTYSLTDAAGNESARSAALSITVDTTAPAAPAAPSAYADDVGAIQSASSSAIRSDDTRPGLRVPTNLVDTPKLYVNGVFTPATYNASAGTLTPNSALPDGVHLFT
jgi:hypothetical protein